MTKKARPRILIADEHTVARTGIRTVLQVGSRCEVCGEALDGRDVVEKVRKLKPDVIVMEALMRGASAIELVSRIRANSPSTKVIVVSIYDSDSMARLAIGADAFITKAQCGMHLNQTIAELLSAGRDRCRVTPPSGSPSCTSNL
jgi:DNA-binding NarL/FixJ family response regulator